MSDKKITQFDIQGRTMVNMLDEEPSGAPMIEVNSKSSVLMDAGLTDTKIIPHNGVPMKEAYMYGNTLVNLQKTVFEVIDSVITFGAFTHILPADTYIIFYTVTKTDSNDRNDKSRNTMTLHTEAGGTIYQITSPNAHKTTGRFYWKVTTTENTKNLGWWTSSLTDTVTVKDVVVLKYQEGMENWDIPYFEGMKSVEAPVFTSIGKNLFDKEAFYNDWKGKRETYVYKEIVDGEEVLKINNFNKLWENRMGFKISVKKGNPLRMSMKCKKAGAMDTMAVLLIRHGDGNNNYETLGKCNSDEWIEVNTTFTPTRDYITICSGYNVDDYFYIKDVQLEAGSVTTSYEPYKVNTLSVPSDLVLRKVGDYADKLDLNTGKLVRYIGEVVLDGSEDEEWLLLEVADRDYSEWSTYQWGYKFPNLAMSFDIDNRMKNGVCDKLKFGKIDAGIKEDYEHYRSNGANPSGCSEYMYIWLEQSKASTTDELKQYLQSNPIKVQYVLATPEITTISLSSVGNYQYVNNDILKDISWLKDGNSAYWYATSIDKGNYEHVSFDRIKPISTGINGIGYLKFNFIDNISSTNQISEYLASNKANLYYLRNASIGTATNVCKLPIYFKSGTMQVSANTVLPSIKYSIPTENYYQLDRAIMNKEYTLQGTESLFCNNAAEANINFGTNLSKIKNTLTSDKVYYSNGYWKRDLTIVEGDQIQVDFPTFYGLKNVVMNEVKTVGKNLVDMTKMVPGNIYQGLFLDKSDNVEIEAVDNTWIRFKDNKGWSGVSSDYIRVSSGETYTYTNQTNTTNTFYRVVMYDINKKFIKELIYGSNTSNTVTIPNHVKYIRLDIRVQNIGAGLRVQLEKGDTFTGFEPYQELAINTANTEMMGLAQGRDTYNSVTNTMSQRCYKVVFDGSADEDWVQTNNTGKNIYYCKNNDNQYPNGNINGNLESGYILCDKLQSITGNDAWVASAIGIGISNNIRLYHPDITNKTVTEFRDWLQDNPLTVVYRLADNISTNIAFDQTQVSNLLNSPLKSIQIPSEISPNTALKVEAPEKQTVTTQSLPSGKMYCDTTPVVVKGDYTNSTLPQNLTLSTATNSEVRIDGISYKLIGTDLRSVPNGVKDELDIKRGKLIRRIGKIRLDGTEMERTIPANHTANIKNDTVEFSSAAVLTTIYGYPMAKGQASMYCDKLPYGEAYNTDTVCIDIHIINKALHFNLPKSELSSYDLAGCYEWLDQNPLTIYYEVETPIETPIQILTQTEYGALETKPEIYVLASEKSKSVFSNSFISTSSENSVNAEVNYTVPMYNYYAANKLDFDTEYKLITGGNDTTNMELNGEVVTLTNDKLTTPSKTNFTKRIIKLPNMVNKFAEFMLLKAESNMSPLHRVFQKMQSVLRPKLVNQIEVKDSTLELYSLPNGVYDELDMITGRYVKRVEKVRLDSEEALANFTVNHVTSGDLRYFSMISNLNNKYKLVSWNNLDITDELNAYCNILETVYPSVYNVKNKLRDLVWVENSNNSPRICFRLYNSNRLLSYSIDGFKQWLIDNQVYVLLELQTPEVSYIDVEKFKVIDERRVQTDNVYVEEGQIPDSNGYYIKPTLDYTLENNSELVTNPLSNTENERVISDLVVKGNTLVNIFPKFDTKTLDKNEHTNVIDLVYPTKVNTKYILVFSISNINLDGNTSLYLDIRGVDINNNYTRTPLEDDINNRIAKNSIYKLIWTETSTSFKDILIGISGSVNINNPSLDISNIMLIEYQEGMENYPIEYFEGLKHVENPVVKVSNKNLWEPIYADLNKRLTSCKLTDKFLVFRANQDNTIPDLMDVKFCGNEIIVKNDGVKTISLGYRMENLKPNTTYTISCLVDMPNDIKNINNCYMPIIGSNGYSSGSRLYRTFNTDQNGTMIKFRPDFSGNMDPLISVWHEYQKFNGTMRIYDIQLHEGNFSAVNPPLEGTVYSTNTTLYSTPMLSDELDMNNGKLTRRLGRIVLDGSEDEVWSGPEGDSSFYIPQHNMLRVGNYQEAINSNIAIGINSTSLLPTFITGYVKSELYPNQNWLYVKIDGITTVDGLRTYLQSNPIEVIYPLVNPITEDVAINKSSNQIPVLRSPEANSVMVTNSITKPNLNIKGKKYRLKDLKPNTSYIIRFNVRNISIDPETSGPTTITLDLGGTKFSKEYSQTQLDRIAITTPTVLQHKCLYIKSTASNISFNEVMVVPNTNLTRTENITFFEGISSTGNAEDNIIKIDNNGIISEVKLNNRLRRLSDTVYDEYIPERGVIIRRVGKLILDGSEEWFGTKVLFDLSDKMVQNWSGLKSDRMICDKLPVINFSATDNATVPSIADHGGRLYICGPNLTTSEEIKSYLAKDPITVYYELANPEIIQVNPGEVPTELEIPVYQSTADHVIKTSNIIPPTLTFKSNAYYELSAQGNMIFSCICEEDVNIEIKGNQYILTNEDPYSPNLRTLHLTCDLSMDSVQVLNQGKVISSFMVMPEDEQYFNYTNNMNGVTNVTLNSTGRNLAEISSIGFNNDWIYATADQSLGQLVINDTMCNTSVSETYVNTSGLRNGYYVASCKLGGMTATGSTTHRLRLGFLSSVDKSVSLGAYTEAFDMTTLKSGIFHITNANTIKAISIIDEMNYTGENVTLLTSENNDIVTSSATNEGIDVQVNTAKYTVNELTLRRFNTLAEAQAYSHNFDVYDSAKYTFPINSEFNSIKVNTVNGSVYYSDLIDLAHGNIEKVIGDTSVNTNYIGSIEKDSETTNTVRFAMNIPSSIDTTLDYKIRCNILDTVLEIPEEELQYVYLDKDALRILVNINKSELNTVDVDGFNEWMNRKSFRVLYILSPAYRTKVAIPEGTYTTAINVKPYSNIQVKDTLPAIVDYIPFKLQEPLALPSANIFTLLFDLDGAVPETGRIILGCVDPADLVYGYECEFTPKLGENRVLLQLPAKKVITNEYMGIDCHGAVLSNVMLFAGDVSTSTQISTARRIIGIESCLEAEKNSEGKYPLLIKANQDQISGITLNEPLRGLPNSEYDEFDFHNHQIIRRVNYAELTSDKLDDNSVVTNGDYINVTSHILGQYAGVNRMISSSYPAVSISEYDVDFKLNYTHISYRMNAENNDLILTINNYPGTLENLKAELDAKPIKLLFNGGEPRIEIFTTVDNELVTTNGTVVVGTDHQLPPYINYEKAEFNLRKESKTRASETQIQLKSSTLYTAIFTLDKANSLDANVRVGLGGTVVTKPLLDGINRYKVAVTTPITLVNNVLSIDAAMARVSNLILLEGDYTFDNYVPHILTAIESVGTLQADGTYVVTIKSDNTETESTVAYASSEMSFNIGTAPLLSNNEVRDEIVYDIVSRSYKLIRRINPSTFETLSEETISNIDVVGELKTYGATHVKGTSNVIPNITLSDIEFAVTLRPSTTYTVLMVSKSILGGSSVTVNLGGTVGQFSNDINKAEHRIVLTTPVALANEKLIISGARNIVKYIRVIEGDHSNSQIPLYFENVYSAGEGDNYINIRTEGKNHWDAEIRNNENTSNIAYFNPVDNSIRTNILGPNDEFGFISNTVAPTYSELLTLPHVKYNHEYTLSFKARAISGNGGFNYYGLLGHFEEGEEATRVAVNSNSSKIPVLTSEFQNYSISFTTNAAYPFVYPYFQVNSDTSSLVIEMKDIQLEHGLTPTTYEEYIAVTQQIKVSAPLRKINDAVYDEICDYKLIRRVGVNEDGSLYQLDQPLVEDVDYNQQALTKGNTLIYAWNDIPVYIKARIPVSTANVVERMQAKIIELQDSLNQLNSMQKAMNTMIMLNFLLDGEATSDTSGFAEYLASQIKLDRLDSTLVYAKYPELRSSIESYLNQN